ELSVYDFEMADAENCRKVFDVHEAEALRLLDAYGRSQKSGVRKQESGVRRQEPEEKKMPDSLLPTPDARSEVLRRFPLRKVYELCLKCSHLFNILDARGAISVTERVALIARIRKMACEVARIYVSRMSPIKEAQPAFRAMPDT